jgi:hypothetical protein
MQEGAPLMLSKMSQKKNSPLAVENLETRLNLSNTLGTAVAAVQTAPFGNASLAGTATAAKPIQLSSLASAKFSSPLLGLTVINPITTPSVGATVTPIASTGTTSIALSNYSAISNAGYGTKAFGPFIGWMTPGNSSVSYQVSTTTAGTYTLNLTESNPLATGTLAVYVNNSQVGTVSITATSAVTTFASKSLALNLGTGTSTIKLQTTGALAYNLGSLSITPPAKSTTSTTTTTTPTTTTPTTTTSTTSTATAAGTTTLASSGTTTVPLNTYSAISNAAYGVKSFGSFIGWMTAGNSSVTYTVKAATAGTYTMNITESNPLASGTLAVYVNNAEVGTIAITDTGSATTFTGKSLAVKLASGTSTIKLQVSGALAYNLGALNFVAPTTTTTTTTTSTSSTSTSSTGTTTTTTTPTQTVGTFSTSPITITADTLTSFTQLDITGTSGNDNIAVSQSGSTITVVANGHTTTYTGAYGVIDIHGEAGNDTINVASNVTEETIVYGDGGTNTIADAGKGWATIVTVGDGTADTVTGNSINTSFWVDPADKVSGTSGGDVHAISSYTNGVSVTAVAPSIADPTGTGKTVKLTNASLWGTGPTITDINQGQLADCYFNASMQAFSLNPAVARNMAVDLGDGTYAIQYNNGSGPAYIRIDGDLPAGGPYANGLDYAHPGASGSIWVPILEKAYAIIDGGNNYANLAQGWMTSVYSAFGITPESVTTTTPDGSLYPALQSELNALNPETVGTGKSIADGAPLIANHAYTITGFGTSNGAWYIQLRNPWGFDGAGNDGNTSDGYIVLSSAQFKANFGSVVLEA